MKRLKIVSLEALLSSHINKLNYYIEFEFYNSNLLVVNIVEFYLNRLIKKKKIS
jgi:hypothetical protein